MTSVLTLPELERKDEQQGFPGFGRRKKPRRQAKKLTKQELLRRAIQQHMEQQRQALFKWMDEHEGPLLPMMFPRWDTFGLGALKMSERMTPILQAIWEPAGTKLTTRVGLDPDSWSVVNPHTSRKIQEASFAFCKETNDSTSQDLDAALVNLRKEMHEGVVTHGESIEQLTKRVQSVFDSATKSRARTIAQTETSRAVHAAQDDAAHTSGVVTGWRWLLSSDACPVCTAIAARKPVTKLGEPFAVIGKNPHYSRIMVPPAHPRCNCTAVEILDTDRQPNYGAHPTLVQPKPSTEGELERIRSERAIRDEQILRESEQWGAAPYEERYPQARVLLQKPAKQPKKPPTPLPKKPRRTKPQPPEFDWSAQQGPAQAGEEAIPEQPKPVRAVQSHQEHYQAVMAAAEKIPDERLWGHDAAFIHHVWEEFLATPGAPKITLSEFKERVLANPLIRAQMVRADMVQAMNQSDVAAAETAIRDAAGYVLASWHFIRVTPKGGWGFKP